jgi:xylose isomerase
MRTYLILKDKARQFAADKEIQALLTEIRGPAPDFVLGKYTRATADVLKSRAFDREQLASRALPYEQLDQLVIDLLLGVR